MHHCLNKEKARKKEEGKLNPTEQWKNNTPGLFSFYLCKAGGLEGERY
jgi:hypothetical protein